MKCVSVCILCLSPSGCLLELDTSNSNTVVQSNPSSDLWGDFSAPARYNTHFLWYTWARHSCFVALDNIASLITSSALYFEAQMNLSKICVDISKVIHGFFSHIMSLLANGLPNILFYLVILPNVCSNQLFSCRSIRMQLNDNSFEAGKQLYYPEQKITAVWIWSIYNSGQAFSTFLEPGCGDIFPFSHKSLSNVWHWCVWLSSSQRCWMWLRSGICARPSSSSTPNRVIYREMNDTIEQFKWK